VSISLATVADADVDLSGIMAVVEDITDRKERERTLRQQRDQLEMLNQVTDLVLRITQELVESSSRERIETGTCKTLAESDIYTSAWIGESRPGAGDVLVRATSDEEAPENQIQLDSHDPVTEGIRACLNTGGVQVVEPGGSEFVTQASGSADQRVARVAIVPLSYLDTVYGVLVVGTDREYGFQDRERSGLATLGKTVGFAINAIANERLLFADTVVDLTFDIGGTDLPLVPTSRALDCTVSLDGFVKATSGETLHLYLIVDGTDGETFVERVLEEPAVQDATIVADSDETVRIEVVIAEGSVLHRIVHLEGAPQSIDLDAGEGTIRLEVPAGTDIDAIANVLQSADDQVEFVSKTRRDRQVTTAAEMGTMIQDRLTERQYEVFKTAYHGGYFEWPRDSTIEDLADNMDIAGATFSHHLRHAQRKLADALLSTGESSD
jgi:predicted DNA binding protein